MHTTGQQLRDEREALELTQVALAAQMGMDRTTIVRNEGKAKVRPSFARRYREALSELASHRTGEAA